jgi:hypothetical protein
MTHDDENENDELEYANGDKFDMSEHEELHDKEDETSTH